VRLSILNAADYGDPQSRMRVFLFCACSGVPLPVFPTPTHGVDNAVTVTARDALKSLELVNPVPGSGRVLVKDPVDGSFRVVTNHNLESTEIKAESKPLRADAPANTVLRQNGVEHYSLPRGLTIRERARLQSFPDDYQFCGSLIERSNQIGNAVPVNVAHAVAKTLYESHINQYEGEGRNHIYDDLEDDWKDLDASDWDWYHDELAKDLARVV
jgi:DNA (cytosine-5)-methyltransferase 1